LQSNICGNGKDDGNGGARYYRADAASDLPSPKGSIHDRAVHRFTSSEMVGWLSLKGSASSLTEAASEASRLKIARRAPLASAANVASRGAAPIFESLMGYIE
jgi:hypothetical protein